MQISDSSQKRVIFIAFIILAAGGLMITGPISQDPGYHLLADDRILFGVPGFYNVFSNLPFAVVGLLGFRYVKDSGRAMLSWVTFFIGLIFVALGSSYYHLNPGNQTLVWDRVPMMVSFMALFVAIQTENLPDFKEIPALPITVLLGLSSVVYWHYFDDLRFYGFMQFAPLASIPFILYLFEGRYTHRYYLSYGLLFYMLAKVFELADRFIFEQTGCLFSGHTIKHLLAAVAAYCVILMLRRRQCIDS